MMTLLFIIWQVIIFLVLISASAFFSGAETGLFSLSRAQILDYQKNPDTPAKKIILRLLGNYRNTLATLIMGNQFVNVMIAIMLGRIIGNLQFSYSLTMLISTIVSVTVLLLFGEVVPKTAALVYSEKISLKLAGVILFFSRVLSPFIILLNSITSFIIGLLGKKKPTPLKAEEYHAFLEIAEQAGAFADEEIELLEAALKLREIPAALVMTSRVSTKTIRTSYSSTEIKKRIRRYKREFFPVITHDLDDAEMIFSAKEFFLMDSVMQNDWINSPCISKTVFIPNQTPVSKALETLYAYNLPAALAVDEFGRCSGMITLKDIIGELVAEIKNMYALPEFEIVKTSALTWRVGGMLPLHLLKETTGIDLPDENEAFTLNGWFSSRIDKLPKRGDIVELPGVRLTAEKIFHHRLAEVKIELFDSASASGTEDEL